MIRRVKKDTVGYFGNGSIRIRPYTLKTKFGGRVELMQCKPRPVGSAVDEKLPSSTKIVLDFSSVESLDVLIEKLQDLREDLTNELPLED